MPWPRTYEVSMGHAHCRTRLSRRSAANFQRGHSHALAPISSSEQMAVWHWGVVLAHLKELGLRLNVRKVCFSSTENHLSGCGVESNHDAVMYVPCSDRVNPHVSQESKRRPVTHCQAVSKTAGSDVSCVQRDTFWPAVHETPTVVAQDKSCRSRGWGLGNWCFTRRGEADMASLGQEVDPYVTRQTSHCPLWLSLNNPALLGLDAMVETWPRLRLYAVFPIFYCPILVSLCKL